MKAKKLQELDSELFSILVDKVLVDKELHILDWVASLDCIYSKDNSFESNCLFIEFKNQRRINIDIAELYSKIYNSVLIFISDNKYSIEECANKNHLLIVYNDNKEKIALQLNNLSSKDSRFKGLERFKKFCFKDNNIIMKIEFDNYIERLSH